MLVQYRYAILIVAVVILLANISLAASNLGPTPLDEGAKIGVNGSMVALNGLFLIMFTYLFSKHVLQDASVKDIAIPAEDAMGVSGGFDDPLVGVVESRGDWEDGMGDYE